MKVIVQIVKEFEVDIDDKFQAINCSKTARENFSHPLCGQCAYEVCQELLRRYPELAQSGMFLQEIYSADEFYTLFEDVDD